MTLVFLIQRLDEILNMIETLLLIIIEHNVKSLTNRQDNTTSFSYNFVPSLQHIR